MMKDINFISHLKKHGVALCLHGDVHEMRNDLINYQTEQQMNIIGVGSFGSNAIQRPESTPRLYNLLEISEDLTKLRVYTRKQLTENMAWEGWHNWPSTNNADAKVAYFDIDLGSTH